MSDNNEIQKPTIDLGLHRRGNLEESALTRMGAQLGYALRQIMAGAEPFLNVKGSPAEIASLAGALGMEKRHMEDLLKHGASSSQAASSYRSLVPAAREFERLTGIPWPFK